MRRPPSDDEDTPVIHAEPWHSQTVEAVLNKLETHLEQGLTPVEAAERRMEFGYNELREAPQAPFWKLVLEQFKSFVVIILIIASIISALLGDYAEAAAIMAIVLLNAIIGVVQESRAEQ